MTAPDRFSEETATFTVQGKDAPDIERGVAAIRNVLRTLPVRPGVYRMTDAEGAVLYIGKARALKNRVTNYTQVSRLSRRLQRMVAQTRDMVIVTTNSEAEALLPAPLPPLPPSQDRKFPRVNRRARPVVPGRHSPWQ